MGGRGASSASSAISSAGSMTAEEAILDFTKEGYRAVRAYQEGKIQDDGIIGKQSEIIEQYILENGGLSAETYRGIILESMPTYTKGDIIDMRGTSSWSTSLGSAKEFGTPRMHGTFGVIFTSNGQKRGVDISAMSDAAHEHEVIVSRESEWIVKGVKKKGSIYYVDLEEV